MDVIKKVNSVQRAKKRKTWRIINDVQRRLLSKRKLVFNGEVNFGMAEYTKEAFDTLLSEGGPDIEVHITSSGGEVTYGLIIYDILSGYPGKIDGLVIGGAKSMAAVILQACTRRMATTHSKILIHHISRRQISLDTLRDKRKLREFIDHMERSQARLYRILAARTSKSIAEIKKVCRKDEDMDAEEAIRFGLLDSIFTGKIKIS